VPTHSPSSTYALYERIMGDLPDDRRIRARRAGSARAPARPQDGEALGHNLTGCARVPRTLRVNVGPRAPPTATRANGDGEEGETEGATPAGLRDQVGRDGATPAQ